MFGNSFNNQNSWVTFSFVFSILIALIQPYLAVSIVLVLVLVLVLAGIYFFGEKILIVTILLTYLTSLKEYVGNIRIYLNLLATAVLLYLFFKEYGFRFEHYPKVPKMIIIFLIALFSNLLVSTLFSSYMIIGFSSIITMLFFFFICYLFYGLLRKDGYMYLYLYSFFAIVLVLALRMFIDLFTLGIQNFFLKGILEGNPDLAGSTGYTGFTIFFISISFVVALLFMNKPKNRQNLILLICFLTLNIIALIFANSRAAIVAAILSTLFMFLILKRHSSIKVIIAALIIFFGVYFSIPTVEDTVDLYIRLDTVSQREVLWDAGLDIIADYPVFGVGPGVFYKHFYSYAPSYLFDFFYLDIWKYGKPSPHNIFLHYWAENGIIGFLLSISLFYLFFYYSFKTIKLSKDKNRDYYIITLAITGIGIGLLFRAFFEVTGLLYYGYITTDLPFWLVFGIMININQKLISNRYIIVK